VKESIVNGITDGFTFYMNKRDNDSTRTMRRLVERA
jgi:hypothetical protein